MKGAIAAGHRLTAEAAADILRSGGNAFDAAIGGFFAACVAEPVLASLGGGGFLLAQAGAGGERQVFDFFAHTPKNRPPDGMDGVDFHPVHADFGATRQEFHIGLGACATPGTVRGMFSVHRHLGAMPMADLVAPAVALARGGAPVNRFQAELLGVVAPIYRTESARPLFASRRQPGALLQPGEVFHNPALAEVLEALAAEGEALFYDGELAARMVEQCAYGGCLGRADFSDYAVHRRAALDLDYRDHRLATNPPPSAGGLLIGFGLEWLKGVGGVDFRGESAGNLDDESVADFGPSAGDEVGESTSESTDKSAGKFGSEAHVRALIDTMRATCDARGQHFGAGAKAAKLRPELLAQYRRQVAGRRRAARGTTHLSIIDAAGNIAALTVSNGEGCGRLLPGAGFMLNNMLGEDDINPGGVGNWRPNQRLSSMMAPSILRSADGVAAIAARRVHIENDALSMEAGLPAATVQALRQDFPDCRVFDKPNMFFGGVHIAQMNHRGQLSASGDPRRDGVGVVV